MDSEAEAIEKADSEAEAIEMAKADLVTEEVATEVTVKEETEAEASSVAGAGIDQDLVVSSEEGTDNSISLGLPTPPSLYSVINSLIYKPYELMNLAG